MMAACVRKAPCLSINELTHSGGNNGRPAVNVKCTPNPKFGAFVLAFERSAVTPIIFIIAVVLVTMPSW